MRLITLIGRSQKIVGILSPSPSPQDNPDADGAGAAEGKGGKRGGKAGKEAGEAAGGKKKGKKKGGEEEQYAEKNLAARVRRPRARPCPPARRRGVARRPRCPPPRGGGGPPIGARMRPTVRWSASSEHHTPRSCTAALTSRLSSRCF